MRVLVFILAILACCASLRTAGAADTADWKVVIETKLQKLVNVELDEASFEDGLKYFQDVSGAVLVIDPASLTVALPDSTLHLGESRLSDALTKFLEPLGLQFSIRDEAIFIYQRNAYTEATLNYATLQESQLKELLAAVDGLASTDFRAREKASEQLQKLGAAAAPYLAKAVKETTDPEVQRRLQKILAHYSARPFPTPSPDAAKLLDTLQTPVVYDVEEQPLSDAVAIVKGAVLRATGKPLTVGVDVELANKPVHLSTTTMQAGHILRWLAVLGGARLVLSGESLKLIKQ